MNRGATATATIELSLGVNAPEGVLIDGHGRPRGFSGWIELAAAIEDWRLDARRPAAPEDRSTRSADHEKEKTFPSKPGHTERPAPPNQEV
jgi:hypothetical protein